MDHSPNMDADLVVNKKKSVDHQDSELLDILKKNETLQPLEAFAKRIYGKKLEDAINSDTACNHETREGEHGVRLAALCSIAVLRAVGAMNTPEKE